MEEKNFDNLIKSRIENTEVPPPPMVWDAVERELQRRRRPAAGYWASGIAVLAVAAVSLLFYFQNEKTAAGTAADFSKNEAAVNPDVNPKILEKSAAGNSAPENPMAAQSDADVKIFSKNLLQKSGKLASIGAKQLALPAVQTPENQTFEKDVAPITADFSEPEKLDWQKNKSQKIAAANLLHSDLQLLKTADPLLPPIKKFQLKPTACYGFSKPVYKALLLDFYAAPVFAEQNLTACTTDFQNYRDRRAAAENYSIGASIGARASLLRGPIVLRSGLDYTQFTEVFNHVVANYSITKTITETIYVNGEAQTRTRTVQEFGELREKIYNRFGLLDLPVAIGAEARFGKFGMSLNAGMAANLLFWKSGRILDPKTANTDQPVGHTDLKEFFNNQTGLSANASLQGFWKMKNQTRLFVEPYFQRTLKTVNSPAAPLDQRYNFYGCRIGLTKVFD